jgi:hypothetical protein
LKANLPERLTLRSKIRSRLSDVPILIESNGEIRPFDVVSQKWVTVHDKFIFNCDFDDDGKYFYIEAPKGQSVKMWAEKKI